MEYMVKPQATLFMINSQDLLTIVNHHRDMAKLQVTMLQLMHKSKDLTATIDFPKDMVKPQANQLMAMSQNHITTINHQI